MGHCAPASGKDSEMHPDAPERPPTDGSPFGSIVSYSNPNNAPPVPGARAVGPHSFVRLKILGKGDVGRVYLVRFKPTGQLFAMKVLFKKDMIDRNKVRRVLTEHEILSSANHPFIVSLHYSFQTEHYLYFVLDYCAGGEFFRMLQAQPGKVLSEDHARFYAAEVLLALEYLHMLGYIYRDLKPENVLMDARGHILLTDFDLAKQIPRDSCIEVVPHTETSSSVFSRKKLSQFVETRPPIFRTNSLVGTAEYIAPEVVQGSGHTSSVDYWTFGVFLYEMLYGRTPFKGRDQVDTFAKIKSSSIVFPATPAVSEAAQNLIRRLLKKKPGKRLGTVHGACDIKNHPFFRSVKWALLRNLNAPITPDVPPLRAPSSRPFSEEDDFGEVEWASADGPSPFDACGPSLSTSVRATAYAPPGSPSHAPTALPPSVSSDGIKWALDTRSGQLPASVLSANTPSTPSALSLSTSLPVSSLYASTTPATPTCSPPPPPVLPSSRPAAASAAVSHSHTRPPPIPLLQQPPPHRLRQNNNATTAAADLADEDHDLNHNTPPSPYPVAAMFTPPHHGHTPSSSSKICAPLVLPSISAAAKSSFPSSLSVAAFSLSYPGDLAFSQDLQTG